MAFAIIYSSHIQDAWPRGGALSSGWLSWLLWGLSLRSMTLHRRGAHLDAFAFLLWQNDQNVTIRSNQNRFESLESLESNALEVQVNWGFWGGVDLLEIVDGRDPDGRLKMDGALWSVVAATVNSGPSLRCGWSHAWAAWQHAIFWDIYICIYHILYIIIWLHYYIYITWYTNIIYIYINIWYTFELFPKPMSWVE